jgi:hypothetical protein
MAKREIIRKPSATLTEAGFVPAPGRKVAGCPAQWTHQDGRTAQVDFGLVGRTGQSAGNTGWAYFVSYGATA